MCYMLELVVTAPPRAIFESLRWMAPLNPLPFLSSADHGSDLSNLMETTAPASSDFFDSIREVVGDVAD